MPDYSPVVDCEEVFGTSSESGSYTEGSASVQLRVPWANARALASDLLYSTDGTPRTWPNNSRLYCDGVTINPEKTKYTTSGQLIIYEFGILDVSYSIPGGSGKEERQPQDPVKKISESIEPYTKVIRLPYQKYVWASDSEELVDGEEPGKIIHGIRLSRTNFNVPSVDNSILTLPGSVHNKSYYSAILNKTFASGTLLFIAPSMNRSVTSAGPSGWNLKCGWDYMEEGWNKVWRVDHNAYDSLKLKDGGAPYNSYPEKDHGAFLF